MIYTQFTDSQDYVHLTWEDKKRWTQGRFIERLKNALPRTSQTSELSSAQV